MGIKLGKSQPTRDVEAIAVAAAETILQVGLLGSDGFSAAISSYFKIVEALKGAASLDVKAMELVQETAAFAITMFVTKHVPREQIARAELIEFTRTMLNKISEYCKSNDIHLDKNHLSEPFSIDVYRVFADDLIYYFRDRVYVNELNEDLKSHVVAFLDEGWARLWLRRYSYFAPIAEALESAPTRSGALVQRREKYRSMLIDRFENQLVFGDDALPKVTVSQVYLPLRCWSEINLKNNDYDRQPQVADVGSETVVREQIKEVQLGWLEETFFKWVQKYDRSDSVRFISGGPGSGKSTFAKKIASHYSFSSRWRVLFIPLQRIHGLGPLESRINNYFSLEYTEPFDSQASALSGYGTDGHKDWLFIFDGLDELAKEGEGSESAAQDFASALADFRSRIPPSVQARLVVLGRAPSMQEARRRLSLGAERTLHVADLLPFNVHRYLPFLKKTEITGDAAIINIDQRPDFWRRWAVAKDKSLEPPAAMLAEELSDLTKEPLLAHLLIISGYAEERWREAAENRNRIYESIFHRIWERESTKPTRASLNDLGESTFNSLLQCLGVAAWRGGGRTGDEATFIAVRSILLSPSMLKAVEGRASSNLANVALLFYTRRDEAEGQGYEFIHKSFGEYLTACGLLEAFDRWLNQYSNPDLDFDEIEILSKWLALAGATRISEEVNTFLHNQVRLKLGNNRAKPNESAVKFISNLIPVVDLALRKGFPVRVPAQDFRNLEQQSINAELALWCILDAYAEVAYPFELCRSKEEGGWQPGPIEISSLKESAESLSKFLKRHDYLGDGGGFGFSTGEGAYWVGSVSVQTMLCRLNLQGTMHVPTHLSGINFRGSDLSYSSFGYGNIMGNDFGFCDLKNTEFVYTRVNFTSFHMSIIDRANFRRCEFGETVDFSPLSKKAMITTDSNVRRYKSSVLPAGTNGFLQRRRLR